MSGKIFYFNSEAKLDCVEGLILNIIENTEGKFISVVPAGIVRVDRIITLYGKPFAAYDEYDSFANACLDCKGGYDWASFKSYGIQNCQVQ